MLQPPLEDPPKTEVEIYDSSVAHNTSRGADHQLPHRRPFQQRGGVRWRCNLEAACQPVPSNSEDGWWPARATDISRAGMRLLLGQPPEPGSLMTIKLPTKVASMPCRLLARVTYANLLPQGIWAVGCEFVTKLSDTQLRSLLL